MLYQISNRTPFSQLYCNFPLSRKVPRRREKLHLYAHPEHPSKQSNRKGEIKQATRYHGWIWLSIAACKVLLETGSNQYSSLAHLGVQDSAKPRKS